jgi:hypothetical protein
MVLNLRRIKRFIRKGEGRGREEFLEGTNYIG